MTADAVAFTVTAVAVAFVSTAVAFAVTAVRATRAPARLRRPWLSGADTQRP